MSRRGPGGGTRRRSRPLEDRAAPPGPAAPEPGSAPEPRPQVEPEQRRPDPPDLQRPARGGRDALAGASRLLVDGSNLLHALGRDRPSGPRPGGEPLPRAALVGRLRAVIPASVRIVLVFDGPPERGLGTSRLAAGLTLRFAGRESADRLLERLVDEDPRGCLVITDDRELGASVRRRGGATLGSGWLVGQLGRQRLAAPSPGRPAAMSSSEDHEQAELARDAEAARRRWSPGRGATRKQGNPRRGHGPTGHGDRG